MTWIGANMMDKKYFLRLFSIFFINIILANEKILLWDFGVEIIPPVQPNTPMQNSKLLSNNQTASYIRKNALISDSFVSPTITMALENTFIDDIDTEIIQIISASNIDEVMLLIGRLSILKNYQSIINMLGQSNFSQLGEKDRLELNYWLANAFFHTGMYPSAKDIILTNTKSSMDDSFQFLLGLIYEAQGKPNKAQETYLKLIYQFPKSEYTVSAQIKARILGRR